MAISFQCPACGADLVLSSARPGHDARCTSCGAGIVVPMDVRQLTPEEAKQAIGGREGEGYEEEELPEEIKRCRFNFGAFFMTPIWLLLHRRYLMGGLLILLSVVVGINGGAAPLLGFLGGVLMITIAVYFGLKGYRIAWEDRGHYDAVDDVKRRERMWAIIGIAVTVVYWTLQILFAL